MGTIGTIYVLGNLSMPDVVKVGKTTRTIEERIKELSGATGVPNQFILLYEQMFSDVDKAELQIHTLLELKGYRHATNREFFNAPPSDIIKIINSIDGKIENKPFTKSNQDLESEELLSSLQDDEFGNLTNVEDKVSVENYPWYGLWMEAEGIYNGREDYIQDFNDAMDLYIKAGKLGCPFVYTRIGNMYLEGEGVSIDSNKALEFFKKGTQEGDYYCYLEMAKLFLKDGNHNNVTKCLKRFVNEYTNNNNVLIENQQNLFLSLEELHFFFNKYNPVYNPTIEFLNFISHFKKELIEYVDSTIEHNEKLEQNYITTFVLNTKRAFRDFLSSL